MNRVLLVSEVRLDEPSGRAADFATRGELLSERGWDIVIGHVPEPYVLTFLPSLWRCYRLANREGVDVINTVSNPFHLHLVGFVVSLLTGLPWLAEFRDPMFENPDRDPAAITTKLARLVERIVVRFADRVVWGDGIQMEDDYFETTYPSIDPETFTKLPFKGFPPEEFDVPSRENDCFTITYAGSFYDGWIEPYAFFDGLARYVSNHGDDLRVQFYGDWRPAYDDAVEEADLEGVVEHHDFIPKEDLVPILKGSDSLLHIGGADRKNRLNVPSKIYDYIGAGRPILAVVDPSFRVAELIRKYNLGVVVPPGDSGAIADAIDALRTDDIYQPDPAVFERFDRTRKVQVLKEIYEGLAAAQDPI